MGKERDEEVLAALQDNLTQAIGSYLDVARWFCRHVLHKAGALGANGEPDLKDGGPFGEVRWLLDRGKTIQALIEHEAMRVSMADPVEEQVRLRDIAAFDCDQMLRPLREGLVKMRQQQVKGE